MMHRLDQSHGNVIGYSLSGEITDDEYTLAAGELQDDIARHGHIRLLFRLSDLPLSSFFSALDERFRFVHDHKGAIERVAVVTDDTATEMLAKVSSALQGIESETFEREEEPKAWAWLE